MRDLNRWSARVASALTLTICAASAHAQNEGGQGGSRTKSIFNLIETTYLNILDYTKVFRRSRAGLAPYPISTNNFNQKIAKALTNSQICSIILL